jgi:hypothetical protein
MPVVFSRNTGRVFMLPDAVAEGAISIGNVEGNSAISFIQHTTIITRIGVAAAGNFQFLHTIGNDVYIYVFGDRMGQVDLHGICFAQDCTQDSGEHGFEKLFAWYEQNRISVRKDPVTVTIGVNKSFEGFVTALTGDAQDAQTRTINFNLTISLLPPID